MTRILCQQCGRWTYNNRCQHSATWRAAYSYVVHDYFGCESGCCGHRAYLCDANDKLLAESDFQFEHPYGASLGSRSGIVLSRNGTLTEQYEAWAREFCLALWPDVPVKIENCKVSDD